MNIEKHRAFLDSLEGEKGLPEEMHRLLIPGKDIWMSKDEFWSHIHGAWYFIAPERVGLIVGSGYYGNADNIDKDVIGRRAESRQIPDLKERVKAFGRDIIATYRTAALRDLSPLGRESVNDSMEAFDALCESEKKSAEVKP